MCVLFDLIRISKYNTHNAPNNKNNKIEEIQGTEVSKQEEEISFQDDNETIEETETTEIENNDIPDFSQELFNMINDYREKNGLCKYTYDTDLQYCANIRAEEASICWSHTRPDGEYFNTVDYLSYGENLAKVYTSASEILEAWKESPTHNNNLLDNEFSKCAISQYHGEDDILYTAIEFSY